MSDERVYSAIDIQLIDNTGYLPDIDPKYVILGMLNEYMGRPPQLEASEIIETFYPGEKSVAETFLVYLKKYLEIEGIDAKIKYSIGPHGHHIYSSAEVRELIEKIYSENYVNSIYGPVHGISEAMFPPLPDRICFDYKVSPVDCRFSYLLGAYKRYGKTNAFQFANASRKVDLIINFVERLGAKWVSKSWTLGGAPRCTIIRFGADEVLARLFGIEPSEGEWDSCGASLFR